MNLVFFGQQGAGKGTYAQRIQDKYGFVQISTGDLFREEIKKGTELGKEVEEKIKNGVYIKDETTARLLEQRLRQKDIKKGFILEGYPRNINQAKILEGLLKKLKIRLDLAINFAVTDETSMQRIGGRRQCPKCNRIYHLQNIPPKIEGKCDFDNSSLYQREDDKPEAIKKRIEQYKELTQPVLDFYKQKRLLREIDANREVAFIVPVIERVLASERKTTARSKSKRNQKEKKAVFKKKTPRSRNKPLFRKPRI